MWLVILLFVSIVFIVLTTTRYKWHPVLSLMIAAFGYGILSGTMSLEEVVKSVNSGFGNTLGLIGIVILAGSIIGKFLEKSGGAYTLAESTLKIVGKKNVPLALSIIGYIVSIVGLIAGWLFSTKIALRIRVDPFPHAGDNEIQSGDKPSATKSLLPIFVPILLILLRSLNEFPSIPFGSGVLSKVISFFGQPVVALIIGVSLSFLLPKKLTAEMISSRGWMGEAIIAAATIIIITGCGGAFGQVLQNSGISDVIKNNLSGAENLSILLPIIIAASLKTAQGSGTVAIVTGASIMAPLLGPLGMDTSLAKALVVVALGAGGMIASHANDSYFWVVTQMWNMNVNQGYKLQTLGTMTVGIFTSVSVWLLSLIVL
jgi:GntP family gluconate:H+ symporter